MFHSLGGSVGLPPLRELDWFIFFLRLSGGKLVPRMM